MTELLTPPAVRTPVANIESVSIRESLQRGAALIRAADGLLITAGAGMGVDSGLPDFRGTEGFWQAYPALGLAKIRFESIANPQAFQAQPRLAWGFYGHRLTLYRTTEPHDGFALLRDIAAGMSQGSFVFTSNVDGQFQKAGFSANAICEAHGSIHHMQCAGTCCEMIWPADDFTPEIDEPACQLVSDLPVCPRCGRLARPNILMFGDWNWLDARQAEQHDRMRQWLRRTRNPVVIELGAGTHIPTVRHIGESLGVPLIRINLRQSEVSRPADVALPMGALAGMRGIAAALS